MLLTIHTDLEMQAENERENLEEDNACLAEVISKGVSSQIILYLPLKLSLNNYLYFTLLSIFEDFRLLLTTQIGKGNQMQLQIR